MKNHLRFFGLFLAMAFSIVPVNAVVDRVIDKTFPVTTSTYASVSADTFSGGINVTTSDAHEVRVLVRQTVETVDDKVAEALLARLDVKLEQTANGAVHLKIVPRHAVRWSWQNWSPAALSLEIIVPRSSQLELRTGEGEITVGAVTGKITARTAAGAIFIGEVTGDITATNGRGDVSVTSCTGALKLTAKSGNILIGRSFGHADLSAVDGLIEVQAARNAVVARGNRSDIKIGFVHPLLEPSELEADGGDVIVNFDPRSAVTINARASKFGSIRVRGLEFTAAKGKTGDSFLVGTLNQGGPLIKIRASGGNVRLNAVPSL